MYNFQNHIFFAATNEDYKLLEAMNKAMSDKYREMNTLASGFTSQMQEVDQKCMCLKHEVTVCICLFFVLVFSMIVCLF